MRYKLTQEDRRLVCIHEAAHAVIFALSCRKIRISRLAVAPVGSTNWKDEKTDRRSKWGVCIPQATMADNYMHMFLEWNRAEKRPTGKREEYVNPFVISSKKPERQEAVRQRHRSFICGYLAGPIAKCISLQYSDNEIMAKIDYERDNDVRENKDECVAAGIAGLMPFDNEFEYAIKITIGALRNPAVWSKVIRLADELEKHGDLSFSEQSNMKSFFPRRWPNWPPAPWSMT